MSRFIKFSFFVLLLIICYRKSITLYYEERIPQWRKVQSVESRLTDDVVNIRYITRKGERVYENSNENASIALNSSKDVSFYYKIYGSNKMEDKIIETQNLSGMPNLGLSNKFVQYEYFRNYIKYNNEKFLIEDDFDFDDSDSSNAFLRPLSEILDYKLYFYRKDFLHTILFILKQFIPIIIIFTAIAIAYHRIIIYISSVERPPHNLHSK
jgi:hypothetical protein